jgi:hypothetical protein
MKTVLAIPEAAPITSINHRSLSAIEFASMEPSVYFIRQDRDLVAWAMARFVMPLREFYREIERRHAKMRLVHITRCDFVNIENFVRIFAHGGPARHIPQKHHNSTARAPK